MKRLPFERPTEHYDERIVNIDEQICALLKQRKAHSDHNPGFPPFEYISTWAAQYELYEDLLKALFGFLSNEEHFRPLIHPSGFRKHVPVLKSIEHGQFFYTLNSVRQYTNASVVTLSIDWDMSVDVYPSPQELKRYKLFIGEPYHCRMSDGGTSSGHGSYNYVISPPLPDDLTGIDFVFKELDPFKNNEMGTEIVFRMN